MCLLKDVKLSTLVGTLTRVKLVDCDRNEIKNICDELRMYH